MLPPRLAAPRGRWPAVRVDVLTGSCDEIRERVATGESNLGLVLEPETGPKAGAALARARLLILGAATHPLTRGVAAAKDLGRGDFCMCDAEGHCHQVLRLHFEAIGAPAPHLQAMGTIEGCRRLPEHGVDAELGDSVLAEVRVSPALPTVVVRAVLAPRRSPVVLRT